MSPEKFTEESWSVIEQAQKISQNYNNKFIESDHLMFALIREVGSLPARLVEMCDLNYTNFLDLVNQNLAKIPKVESQTGKYLSKNLEEIIQKSEGEVKNFNDTFVAVDVLFWTLVSNTDYKKKFDLEKLKESIKKLRGNKTINSLEEEKKWQGLETYGSDLTALARKALLEPVIGRDDEIRRIIQILLRKTKNNPVVIGEAGVGKTAIIEGLAQKIVRGEVPEGLKNKKIISLQISSILAGARYKGDFEERFKLILTEVGQALGEVILFIDELHSIMGTGKTESGLDIGNMLKPALARGELRMIGATTLNEYRIIEKDSALERRFQPVMVAEPSISQTISILRGIKERFELHHGVRIADQALVVASNLADRYLTGRKLPDKAIDLVDEAASKIRMQLDSFPEEIDRLENEKITLQIEKQSLLKENSKASLDRLHQIDSKISQVNSVLYEVTSQWNLEKETLTRLRQTQEQVDENKKTLAKAMTEHNLDLVAKIQYGDLPTLETALNSMQQLLKTSRFIKLEVSPESISEVVSKITGIPLSSLIASEKEKLLSLESYLHQKIIGQDEAIVAISNAIRRSRAGLKDQHRPIGSFIFLGPTGVGKTELSKTLAEFLFDTPKSLVTLDMSEYMEKSSISRLIGSPPGYVGFDIGGQLTEKVRRTPYCVVLFDEIEKAHPDVLNLLLQILDEGRLTDSQGRIIDFKNTIIILTSNLGSKEILSLIQDQKPAVNIQKTVQQILESNFKPEFINRIDDIVVFKSLSHEEISQIAELYLQMVAKKLWEQGCSLHVSQNAKEYLIHLGFDPQYGARPLRRVISREVENKIAEFLLSTRTFTGQTIHVGYDTQKGITIS